MKRLGLVVVLAVGCGDRGPVDVGPINALVAGKDRARLHFKNTKVTTGVTRLVTYSFAAPAGWKPDSIGVLEPAAQDDHDEPSMWVRSTCDSAECPDEDFDAAIEDRVQHEFLNVLRDDHGKGKRTVVSSGGIMNPDSVAVTVMWWTPGGHEIHTCSAHLDAAAKDSLPAFEKACQSVVVGAVRTHSIGEKLIRHWRTHRTSDVLRHGPRSRSVRLTTTGVGAARASGI